MWGEYREFIYIKQSAFCLEVHLLLISLLQVFCQNCDELLTLILAERQMNPTDCHVHCGFDSGQGILKIAISVTDKNEVQEESCGRAKYSQVTN